MIQVDDLCWPGADLYARPVILRSVKPAIRWLLDNTEGRTQIIQAGGNVGVYPMELAAHFERVLTAEPDPENFECLRVNVRGANVDARACAFGARTGLCRSMEVDAHNCGAHRIELGGDIPVFTIDSFFLDACDCIWLDIEGYEYFALQGASQTIEEFHPTLILERKGLEKTYGVSGEMIDSLLTEWGYTQVSRHGNDRMYK